MSQLEKFAEVVRYCNETYQRSMNDAYFDRNFFWRTPEEIKASGEIHYLCCSERTLMVSQHALEEGLESRLILSKVQRLIKGVKVGTAIEITLDGISYRFISGNSGAVLKPGHYRVTRRYPMVYSVDASLDDTMSYFAHFGINSPSELERFIPGFDYSKFEEEVRRRASARDFNRRTRKIARLRTKRKHGLLVK